jgi:triphosphatase
MDHAGREIELKLAIPDARTMAVLARLRRVGPFALGSARVVRIEDTYLDTADGRLRRAGWACRIRKGGVLQVTVKSLSPGADSVHDRQERQEEIASANLRTWPVAIQRFVDERAGGMPLVALFRIRQRRRQCIVSDDGQELLELSLDEFRVRNGTRRGALYRTLEAELLPGADAACIPRFAAELARLVTLAPEPLSKYEIAQAETARR